MSTFWKVKTALISAAKGWTFVWLLLVPWEATSLLRGHMVGLTDVASIAIIWMIATGMVTLGATILFIVPYVCLMNVDKMLAAPWRIYLETSLIVILISFGLVHAIKPQAYTFWRTLPPYLAFALASSLASSFFFIQALKKLRADTREPL